MKTLIVFLMFLLAISILGSKAKADSFYEVISGKRYYCQVEKEEPRNTTCVRNCTGGYNASGFCIAYGPDYCTQN